MLIQNRAFIFFSLIENGFHYQYNIKNSERWCNKMPRFNGTGPLGQGPLTGRGMGYCMMNLPAPGTNYSPYGYAGIEGSPYYIPPARPFGRMAFRGFGRGRGMGRGRGNRFRAYC